MTQSTDGPEPQDSPAPSTTPRPLPEGVRLAEHRPPAPTPSEHNAAYIAKHGHTTPTGFDSAGQRTGGH